MPTRAWRSAWRLDSWASASRTRSFALEDPPYKRRPASDRPLQQPGVRGATLGARRRPLTGTLRYMNMLDIIQGEFSYATSMTNAVMLRRILEVATQGRRSSST
jgi:hypothetical protein